MEQETAVGGFRDEIAALHPNLIRFARSLTASQADAEDLAQATLERAIRFENTFEPGTNAKAWLFTICRRLHQRSWRSQRTRPSMQSLAELGEDDILVSPLSVEPTVMRRFEGQAILNALAQLKPEHGVPVRLYAGEGMPYRQIAEVLDLPLGTVMSRIYRGRRTLVKLLLEAGLP
ncbi:MAG: RNA polymerase sigma factor [Candidatus Dormibacteraeota bacterium]|nr:RNA polymerase sigma factor [Candidatus Dormibacteraeota bacterium]